MRSSAERAGHSDVGWLCPYAPGIEYGAHPRWILLWASRGLGRWSPFCPRRMRSLPRLTRRSTVCAGCRARRAWLSLPAAITVLRRLLDGGVPRMLAVGPATRAPQHALATGLDAASPTVEVMDGPELPQLAEAIPDPEQEAAIPGLTGKWLVRTVPGDVERAS